MSNPDGTPSDESVEAATEEARGYVREGLATELGGELAGLRSDVHSLHGAIDDLDGAIDDLGATWARALDARVTELRRERRRTVAIVLVVAAVFSLVAGLVIAATREDAIADELCPLDVRIDRLERIADDLITTGEVDPDRLTPEVCR